MENQEPARRATRSGGRLKRKPFADLSNTPSDALPLPRKPKPNRNLDPKTPLPSNPGGGDGEISVRSPSVPDSSGGEEARRDPGVPWSTPEAGKASQDAGDLPLAVGDPFSADPIVASPTPAEAREIPWDAGGGADIFDKSEDFIVYSRQSVAARKNKGKAIAPALTASCPPLTRSRSHKNNSSGANEVPADSSIAAPTPEVRAVFWDTGADAVNSDKSEDLGPYSRQCVAARKNKGKAVTEAPALSYSLATTSKTNKHILEQEHDPQVGQVHGDPIVATSTPEAREVFQDTGGDAVYNHKSEDLILHSWKSVVSRRNKGKAVMAAPAASCPLARRSGSDEQILGQEHDPQVGEEVHRDPTVATSTPEAREVFRDIGGDAVTKDKSEDLILHSRHSVAARKNKGKAVMAAPVASCPPARRSRSDKGQMKMTYDDSDLRRAFSVPYLNLKKKRRMPKEVQKPILPEDFVKDMRAYFASIDATELVEEEASESDQD